MASARKYKCEEMDSLSLLPEEVQEMILQLLSVQDLENCFRVSKPWNQMANTNRLWKRHCLSHGITPEEEETFEEDSNSTLCRWAQIWFKFRNSPSYGWQTNSWRSQELERKSYLHSVTDGKSFAYCTEKHLFVLDISKLENIKYNIELPFSLNKTCNIEVHEQYIAIAKSNIMVFYKLMNSQYEPVLIIAIIKGVIIQSCTNIATFVKENYIEDFPGFSIKGFNNSCLWMMVPDGSKTYIVNLIDNTVSPVEYYTVRSFSNTNVVSWKYRKLQVEDYFGRKVFVLHQEVERAVANDKLLLTFSRNIEYDYERMMESWNLSTNERHLCIPCPDYKFIELHPTRNIIYQNDPLNCIKAFSAITGAEYWSCKLPVNFDTFGWGLKIICEKYLVLFQFKCCCKNKPNKLYVFNADNGQFLYKTHWPFGFLYHISDNLLVTLSSNKFFMRIFSNV